MTTQFFARSLAGILFLCALAPALLRGGDAAKPANSGDAAQDPVPAGAEGGDPSASTPAETGYPASTTISCGGCGRVDLRDMEACISLVTEKLLKEVAGTDVSNLLCYTNEAQASAPVEWLKVHRRNELVGMFTKVGGTVEIYSFAEKLCMITVHPADTADETVAPGWTDSARWKITKRGLIKVTGSMLKRPAYFALVRIGEARALVRLETARASPPERLSAAESDLALYKEQRNSVAAETLVPVRSSAPAARK